jgi:hypothetical protein
VEHGPEGKFSPRDHGARSRGEIFSSGPWSTVPRGNFLLGTMEHGPEGKFSPRDRGARSRGEIFSSGPWSTVPRGNFLLGTMEHGPEGRFSSWDLVPRKRCESRYEEHRIGPKWTETRVPLTKNLMRKLNLV